MDFYAMSSMMKDLIPSDPEADKQALMAAAGKTFNDVPATKDYVTETAQVAPGSLPLDLDLGSLASLAGIPAPKKTTTILEASEPEEVQKSLIPGLNRTKDDVGSDDPIVLVQQAIRRAMDGEVMQPKQREAFAPYAAMLEKILEEPRLAGMLDNIMKLANKSNPDITQPEVDEPKVAEPEAKESITTLLKRQLEQHMENRNV
jgi:hypothetical protein|tara:strand:+ start:611 stop:1219 length:609 start_codon:yes stop_codon:yes gene_type:complete